jgi:hypothetical protein
MREMIRTLRDKSVSVSTAGFALGVPAMWPLATGRLPNLALLAMAIALLTIAAIIRLQKRS